MRYSAGVDRGRRGRGSTSCFSTNSSTASQYSSPGVSRNTIGTGMPLPVWVKVSSSNVSSSVPNPPGRQTNARLSLTSISLRVKKYFMLTYFSSPAMIGLAPCSNGSRIDTPIACSRPAPSMPACMIPGPAPVMTIHPVVGEAGGDLARLLVERIVVLGVRAEPKIVTFGASGRGRTWRTRRASR